MFWHDQTKVGNYDAAIRIPERLYQMLEARQRKTLDPVPGAEQPPAHREERARMALFPTNRRNRDCAAAAVLPVVLQGFRPWARRPRHRPLGRPTRPATPWPPACCAPGRTLTHIRRYLGQVSDRMAEHYVHLSHSDLENVLQQSGSPGPAPQAPASRSTGKSRPAHPGAGPGPGGGPVPPQHAVRGRVLHLPARRRRRCLPLEPGPVN